MESPILPDLDNSTYNSQSLCNRCRIKQGEFFCNECSPFNIFCSECDTFIHSLPTKRNHQRELITQKLIYNETNQNESTLIDQFKVILIQIHNLLIKIQIIFMIII